MPLAREQRTTIARVLRWSRSNGWVHDAYPHTWRSTDGLRHVRYDATDATSGYGDLVVDHMTDDPLRCRVAVVPVATPEAAVDVLAALGCVPVELSPMGRELLGDGHALLTYRTLINNGQHRYMSTYCQHDLHDDCRRTCKCCEAPCLCDLCLHTAPEATEVRCLKRYGHEDHPPHRWQRDDEWVRCNGWPLLCAITDDDDPDSFDGPASFIDAGQALADLVEGRVSPELAAEVLSKLARNGLIVSVAYHDETCGEQAGADAMRDVEAIFQADDQ